MTQSAKLVNQIEQRIKKTMFDENLNGGNKMQNGQPVKLTLKDKRRPTPLDVRLATQRARGEGTVLTTNGALSTPDIVNVTTPVLQNLLIQNQLADFDGQTGNLVKQEISEENTASVTSSASGNMSVSGQNEEQTVIPQRDHDDDQNMVGQGSSDENILNQAAIQKALIQAVGVKNGNVISTSLIPSQPIDMTAQEEEKLDRKRQRNRVAATKCRKRKIERITQLEQEVRELNDSLQKRLKQKRELEIEVDEIRNRLKIHIKQGCSGLEEYLQD